MSAKYTYLAWDQEGIKGNQLLVLLQIANNANDDGLSWYSIEKMANRCKIGVRTFQENLKTLEKLGLVTITRRQNKTSIYQLNLGVQNPQGADSAGGGCEIRTSRGAKSADDPNNEPNTDPNKLKNTKKNGLDFSPLGLTDEQIGEWKDLRKKANTPVTQRVINSIAKEFDKSRQAGFTNDQILDLLSEKGWKGYKHDWMLNANQAMGAQAHGTQQRTKEHNGIGYGEHADQSIFPNYLQIATNDMPDIKATREAAQLTYLKTYGSQVLGSDGAALRASLENDEWQ